MDELKELRLPHKGKGKGNPKDGGDNHPKKGKSNKRWTKKIKGRVAAAIKQHTEDKAKLKEKEEGEISEIAKIISAAQPSNANQDASAATAAMKLNTILKRKRDQ